MFKVGASKDEMGSGGRYIQFLFTAICFTFLIIGCGNKEVEMTTGTGNVDLEHSGNGLVADSVRITETTVGNIDGVEIGVGNVYKRVVEQGENRGQSLVSAQLFADEERKIVFEGQVVKIGGVALQVLNIVEGESGGRGWVVVTSLKH